MKGEYNIGQFIFLQILKKTSIEGKNLKELYLSDYEVLNNEPLHDVSHHIEHLYEELPHHTPKDFKKSLKEII